MIDAAIHQLEFHCKEVTNHPYPYGIKLLLFFPEAGSTAQIRCGYWSLMRISPELRAMLA